MAKTVVRESAFAGTWAHLQVEATPELIKFRRSVEPEFVPSGVSGLLLRRGDHIALVVEDESGEHLDIIKDFLAAGYRNGGEEELLSLELTENRNKEQVSNELAQQLGPGFSDRLDVRDWVENNSDFEQGASRSTGRFTRPGMWQAMNDERRRMRPDWEPMLRCASEDCSLFIRWLENPDDYLKYEARLGADLERIVPSGFVQLCTFRSSVLRDMDAQGVLPLGRSVADILASHNRVVLLDREGVHLDAVARTRIEKHYELGTGSRFAAKARARLAALVATLGPEPRELPRRIGDAETQPGVLEDNEASGDKSPVEEPQWVGELRRLGLARPNLAQANLMSADLGGADLAGVDLTKADLRGARMRSAILTGADLTLASLTGAELTKADFGGAKLAHADLSDADLSGANFVGADLAGAYVDNARWDHETRWPEDLRQAVLERSVATGNGFVIVGGGSGSGAADRLPAPVSS
ncbi:pentapeptide repeat-containing protein [Calidifontibacter indicus]|uniref:pentapeptide repeat-containing protein n=1 Tax=Calidifontibacter indicus TaxID=419650 RepID=UPI003D730227